MVDAHSGNTPKRVFISYTHDSEEHKAKVLEIADSLREYGVECILDQYEQALAKGDGAGWMAKQIRDADYVLLVCTPEYYGAWNDDLPAEQRKGARWEILHIRGAVYKASSVNDKFLPVLVDPDHKDFIPEMLATGSYYVVADQAGFEALYWRITKQHDTEAPEVREPVKRSGMKLRPRFSRPGSGNQGSVKLHVGGSMQEQKSDKTEQQSQPINTLIIRHEGGDELRFCVVRQRDNKIASSPTAIQPPRGFPVEGRPDSDLLLELRWYLEEFLDYPFDPHTDRADRIQDSLKQWGRQAFDALFDNRAAGKFLDEAAPNGQYAQLHLQISSDDPTILAWPWEALRDSKAGLLAQQCQIERRLNEVLDPPPINEGLPRDRVNILLVTARPYAKDVQYRSISRPLVELIQEQQLPAHVTVLRPPTFDQLRRHLREHPHHYHILHFDGHGGYGKPLPGSGGGTMFTTGQKIGCLVFENARGEEEPITADRLSELLRETAVPAVVLNACQSAMLDEDAEDPFASVAAALIQSGVHSVVAMAYSLYVSAAQAFLPAFYERLFDAGDMAQAVRAGRQQMHAHPERVSARGKFPLQDWLVPVVYQQDPLDFSFAAEAKKTAAPLETKLPEEAADDRNPYGFIGRDAAMLELERAMLRAPAGILITGLGGVGKTTLARGFLKWLEDTEGLGHGCMWFTFADIYNAEFVINRMGEAFFGGNFSTAPLETRIEALAKVLKANRVVIVWDNFEVVRGIPDTHITANLTEEDRGILRSLLEKMRGGASKVIITSRSREEWLGSANCFELAIGGLAGEERWDYCEAVLSDLGIHPNRDDAAMVELMELLGGHALAMRAILPRLKDMTPSAIASSLKGNLAELDLPEDEVASKLAATLRFVEDSLPAEQRPLLIPLGLHEGFVEARLLEAMAKQVDEGPTRAIIDRFTGTLCVAGLLRDMGQSIYQMHPALTGYLRAVSAKVDAKTRDAWARAFVDVMGSLADSLTQRELHEQRIPFHIHGANFHHALGEAERLDMNVDYRALLQSLAAFAQNTRDFAGAAQLFARLAEVCKRSEDHEGEAAAYHQLGRIAQEQRDFTAAEKWYRKSLAIKEKQGDEHGAASTYHQLGRIAQEQRDFIAAEKSYRKALAIFERQGNEHHAASTYHQLGVITQEQRDFTAAEKWYRKALAIKEKQGNEHGAASTYHQLGIIAQEQRDFTAAEKWYRKSLEIEEKQDNEHGAASTYHQLGIIAQEQRDFTAAEKWYRKSLAIKEKQGNEHGAAITYHQLGMVAEEQRDFTAAEKWYRKSLAIEEKQGNEHGAASTYGQLGNMALEQRDFSAAEKWYRKSLAIAEKQGNEHGAASTYGQLGILAGLQEHYEESGRWLIKCIQAFARSNDKRGAHRNAANFMVTHKNAPPNMQAKLEAMWREAGLGDLPKVGPKNDG